MTTYDIPAATLTCTAPAPGSLWGYRPPAGQLGYEAPGPLLKQQIVLTTRWTFYDPVLDETFTMPINPDSMTNPLSAKVLTYARSATPGGRYSTIRQPTRPVEWEFSGVIRTQAHHDALDQWADRRRIIRVKDHLNRVFEVMLTSFEVTERAPTKTVKWRLRYTMKALVLRQLA